MSEPPARPPAGWYADPADRSAVRWWDGFGWTYYRATRDPSAPGPGTHAIAPERILVFRCTVALTFLAIPVNLLTIAWANRLSQDTTNCNAPLSWDQSALGVWVPLGFVALALGCLVTAIVMRTRTRNTASPPIGFGTIAMTGLSLLAALGTGLAAVTSMALLNWCF